MATMPTRIDQELFDAARSAGELHSRSAAQQIDHWARLGRELEASPGVTHGEIERVLSGQAPYDGLSGPEQAVVRLAWSDQIAERVVALDFASGLTEAGAPWAEADVDGNIVIRDPAE